MFLWVCYNELTSGGFLVVLYSTSPLHFHHTPLNAAVANVTEVLGVSLYTLSHKVSDGGSEAAFILFKVLVVVHLWGSNILSVIPVLYVLHIPVLYVGKKVPELKFTSEMMRWACFTRLISGVSSTKAALPCICLRKLSEYSTWGVERRVSAAIHAVYRICCIMSTSQVGRFQEGGSRWPWRHRTFKGLLLQE